MKTYNFKRADVTEIPNLSLSKKQYLIIQKVLLLYQTKIKKFQIPLNLENPDFDYYRHEIQKIRDQLRQVKGKTLVFRVFVKKYKQIIEVNYEYSYDPTLDGTAIQYKKKMLKQVIDQALHQFRQSLKETVKVDRIGRFTAQFSGSKKKNGRVFSKSGEILRLYVNKQIEILYNNKTPIEPRKYIGIELEFCAPIEQNEFAIKLFQNGIHKFAQLKKDGSLRPKEELGEHGYELAILLEERNFKKQLKKITDLLVEIKAVAKDRRAGLHVHVDMRRRNKDLVYNNLVACQHALLSIVDPCRIDNEFCRIVKSRKFPTKFTGNREERYKTINAAAFYKFRTLEVRMHEGSVDFTQISNWVSLLIRIASSTKKLKNNVSEVSALKKRFVLNKKLYSYFQDRSCFWQIQATDRSDQPMVQDRLVTFDLLEQVPAPLNIEQPGLTSSGGTAILNEIEGRFLIPENER